MIQVTLTTREKVVAKISPHVGGIPIAFDGVAEWGIISGEGTVEAADDGMSAELVSSDLPGVTLYLVTIDADVGLGVQEVSELVQVTSLDTNGIFMSASQPIKK